MTEAYLDTVIKQFPQGFVDFGAFNQILQQRQPDENDTEEQVVEAFRVFDKDQQGTIALSELQTVLSNLGEKLTVGWGWRFGFFVFKFFVLCFKEDEVDELLREAGMQGQQQIDYRQFARVIMGN